MTNFRPDTTFPYLKIAREHGVPYGDVLRVAETWCKGRPMTDPEKASFRSIRDNEPLRDVIIAAFEAEMDRRDRRDQC